MKQEVINTLTEISEQLSKLIELIKTPDKEEPQAVSIDDLKQICNKWIDVKHIAKGEDVQTIYNVISQYAIQTRQGGMPTLDDVPTESYGELYKAISELL